MKSLEQREPAEKSLEYIRRVAAFIRSAAEKLREDDRLPVRNDGRIDMSAFSDVHPDLKKDEQTVRKWQKEWHGNLTENELEEERLKSDGEKLELLKSAIFTKNLGSEFIVTRASLYDDIKNGIDNVLIERHTGYVVCALDEISTTSGVELETKKERVLKRNMAAGGATLKYGIILKDIGGQKQFTLGRIEHIPVFYIALPKEHIEKGLENFSASGQSDFEKSLFEYFISTLHAQVKGLELFNLRLDSALKERAHAFRGMLDSHIRKTVGE